MEALATPKFAAIKAEVDAGVAACPGKLATISRSAAAARPASKLAETGRLDVAETLACRLRVKLVTDIVLEAIENSVEAGAAFGALAGSADDLIVVWPPACRKAMIAGLAVRSWIMNMWPPSKNCSSALGMRPAIRSWVCGNAARPSVAAGGEISTGRM